MLKIPKVSFETVRGMAKGAEGKQKGMKVMEAIMEGFTSELPALVSMIGAAIAPLSPMYAAALVWKAIKTECENSALQSFMEVK